MDTRSGRSSNTWYFSLRKTDRRRLSSLKQALDGSSGLAAAYPETEIWDNVSSDAFGHTADASLDEVVDQVLLQSAFHSFSNNQIFTERSENLQGLNQFPTTVDRLDCQNIKVV